MNKVKTVLVSMLAFVALVLGGCSDAAQQALDSDSNQETNVGEGTIEIEYWYGLGSVAGETMEEIIQEFNASQSDVVVTGVQQPSYSDTIQELQAALAADTAPAVFINDNLFSTVNEGMVDSMNDLPAETFPEEDYLEVFWGQGILDDTRYSLPAYGTTQVMYYRSDILEEQGINPDDMYATWEDVKANSQDLIDAGAVEYGHLPMYGSDNLADIALSNGGQFLSEDGTEVLINSPEWVEAWTFIQDGIEDGTWKINSGGQGWEYWYNTIDDVLNGVASGYTGSSGDKGDLDFSIIGSAVQPGLNDNEPAPTAGALQFSIPAGTDQDAKQAAYQWIAYFTSPEVQAKWSQAIGYIPVNNKTMEVEEYQAFLEENPAYEVPYQQALHATPSFVDPTGGQISDALSIAADQVLLEGIDPQQALDEAQAVSQEALDNYLAGQ